MLHNTPKVQTLVKAYRNVRHVRYARNCLDLCQLIKQQGVDINTLDSLGYANPIEEKAEFLRKAVSAMTWHILSQGTIEDLKTADVDFDNWDINDPEIKDLKIDHNFAQYFYIQGSGGSVAAAVKFYEGEKKISGTFQTATNFYKKGYATTLRWVLMRHALTSGKTMFTGSYLHDGQRYLAPKIPELHKHIPDLKIEYSGNEPIDGHRPYKVRGTGNVVIEFEDLSQEKERPALQSW